LTGDSTCGAHAIPDMLEILTLRTKGVIV